MKTINIEYGIISLWIKDIEYKTYSYEHNRCIKWKNIYGEPFYIELDVSDKIYINWKLKSKKYADKLIRRKYTIDGIERTLKQLSRDYNIAYNTLYARLMRWNTIYEALNFKK